MSAQEPQCLSAGEFSSCMNATVQAATALKQRAGKDKVYKTRIMRRQGQRSATRAGFIHRVSKNYLRARILFLPFVSQCTNLLSPEWIASVREPQCQMFFLIFQIEKYHFAMVSEI